ncbi:MAG: cytochrome c biogenesis protein CcsA [Kiritimatiellae bacterium]|nr:cytochrome c biogenesis protein CcsA [Kiritimatiellia bacterium]
MRIPSQRAIWLARLLLATMLAPWWPSADASAAPPELREWTLLPVLEGGRPMPLSAFARLVLLQMSGRGSVPQHRSASAWLGDVLFRGEATEDDPVFLIGHPDLADALGLTAERPRFRTSYRALAPALDRLQRLAASAAARPAAERSALDREALRLASAAELYASLRRGLAPHIVPGGQGPHAHWLAPADLSEAAASRPIAREALATWNEIAAAWRSGDAASLAAHVRRLRDLVIAEAAIPHFRAHLEAEGWLVRVRPFWWACLIWIAAALWPRRAGTDRTRRLLRTGGAALLAIALGLHTAGLGLRAFIMGRPPVTNLYSTFIFAAWASGVAAGIGLVRRSDPLRRGGAAVAAVLLLAAGRYEADGDTMARVVAVLDSNLWLTAHVMTIMLGYAGCLLAGAIGHAALWTAARHGPDAAAEQFRAIRACLAFGLVFTFLGTTLGGVWADLSWGRFWGWDPKENGALLIILWTSAVLHARASGLIRDAGLAAGAVVTVAVVLTAWLGVNLLGIGLHAYGFTSGTARGWMAATLFELAFATLGLLAVRHRIARELSKHPPASSVQQA